MASDISSHKPNTFSKQAEQSPDLILEVESIAGDSDCGRHVESTTSESASGETETIRSPSNIYATEICYDDALVGASGSESEYEQIAVNAEVLSANPDRPQKFTIKLLHDWCVTNKMNIDLSNVEPEEFDKILCRFYAEVRSKTGRRYSRNTIMAIRYGLNRHFANMKPPRKVDIIDDDEFKNSNVVFKTVVSNAVRENPERASLPISTADLRKIYSSNAVSPSTPLTLLLKVWFEVSVYFNRKRSKLQRDTKITDFLFDVDSDGRRFVTEVVKGDKRSQLRMYEKVGDWMCPFASLEKLLTKIDPNCQYLFQRPRQIVHESATIWYHPERIGRNFASQMMGKISKLSDLDNKYTNVSVKKLTAWNLEELVFLHRHLSKEADVTHASSLTQQANETPSKVDSRQSCTTSSYSASSVSRAILPVPPTRSIACNTEDHKASFRPYVRRRADTSGGRKGPEAIDLNTAKAKVKRIFQRLEYTDLVTLVDWLKRIDVLKDTTGTVFCRENCLKLVDLPQSARRFTPRQVQPLQPTQATPFILPSPLSVSHYLMNSAVKNATSQPRPAAIYLPNFPYTTQTQTGVSVKTLDSSQQKSNATSQDGAMRSTFEDPSNTYSGIANASCPQAPVVRGRQPLPIAPRQNNAAIPCKTTSTIGSFQLSTITPSQATNNNCVTTAARQFSSSISGTDTTVSQQDVPDTEDNTLETCSPCKKLKISDVTGESKVWKIL